MITIDVISNANNTGFYINFKNSELLYSKQQAICISESVCKAVNEYLDFNNLNDDIGSMTPNVSRMDGDNTHYLASLYVVTEIPISNFYVMFLNSILDLYEHYFDVPDVYRIYAVPDTDKTLEYLIKRFKDSRDYHIKIYYTIPLNDDDLIIIGPDVPNSIVAELIMFCALYKPDVRIGSLSDETNNNHFVGGICSW